jgi:hypothetical protein
MDVCVCVCTLVCKLAIRSHQKKVTHDEVAHCMPSDGLW